MARDDDARDSPVRPTEPASPNRRWMAATVQAAPPPAAAPVSASVFDAPVERYVEVGELGRGGMGRVALVRDRALDREVAIKHSLATSLHDVARFEREVRITARLQHPSIVPILDVGRDTDGKPFYVMRRIDGEPLSERVGAGRALTDRLALVPALLGAIDAAAYAHAQRVIHRDIKPWNILLGPYGETLLIDWGIARELDSEDLAGADEAAETKQVLTRFGTAIGSPGFIAPEQARGEDADARADVYSLGATLYFVLVGDVPFAGVQGTVAIAQAAEGRGPDLGVLRGPPELVAIVTKALAPIAADRYADASELAADLRRFLGGQLVAAHAYTSRERVGRWVRKHRIAVTVGGIALAVIAAVSVVSVRRVIADRDRAREASRLADARADEMLVDRARALLTTDPTSAVAALRGLRASSPLQPTAAAIARAAVSLGVERRVGQHAAFVSAVQFSPDGTLLASAGDQIVLHDLRSNTTRVLAQRSASALRWRDAATLVYYYSGSGVPTEVGTIDIASGRVQPITEPEVTSMDVLAGAVIVRTEAGLVARHAADGTRTVLAETGATAFAARGELLVVFGREQFAVFHADRTTHFLTDAPGGTSATLSSDGTRVALLGRGGIVREWSTSTGALLGQWQRPQSALNEIGYVEDTLYTWSNAGLGFMSLEREPQPRWTVRERRSGVFVGKILPFAGGALLANDSGALALADRYGVAPLAHRILAVTRAAIAPQGQRVAIGTSTGEVLVMDLGPVRPALTAMPEATDFGGASATHALLLTRWPEDQGFDAPAMGPDGNGILVDLATDARTPVQNVTLLLGDVLIGGSADGSQVILRDVATRAVRASIPKPRALRTGDAAVFYVDTERVLWKQPVAPWAPAQRLGALPADALRDGDMQLVRIDAFADEPVVVTDIPTQPSRVFAVAGNELREVALGLPPFVRIGGRSRDGAYWGVEQYRTLWTARPGERARAITLPRPVELVTVEGDQVRAFSTDTLMVLDLEGRVLHEYGFASRSSARTSGEHVVAFGDVDGVVELMPATNVRRLLRTPGTPISLRLQRSPPTIVAVIQTATGTRYLARWIDPPATPPSTLTNGTLEPGSDAITWD